MSFQRAVQLATLIGLSATTIAVATCDTTHDNESCQESADSAALLQGTVRVHGNHGMKSIKNMDRSINHQVMDASALPSKDLDELHEAMQTMQSKKTSLLEELSPLRAIESVKGSKEKAAEVDGELPVPASNAQSQVNLAQEKLATTAQSCSLKDSYEQCPGWKAAGYCTDPLYESLLQEYCPLSCYPAPVTCDGTTKSTCETESQTCYWRNYDRSCLWCSNLLLVVSPDAAYHGTYRRLVGFKADTDTDCFSRPIYIKSDNIGSTNKYLSYHSEAEAWAFGELGENGRIDIVSNPGEAAHCPSLASSWSSLVDLPSGAGRLNPAWVASPSTSVTSVQQAERCNIATKDRLDAYFPQDGSDEGTWIRMRQGNVDALVCLAYQQLLDLDQSDCEIQGTCSQVACTQEECQAFCSCTKTAYESQSLDPVCQCDQWLHYNDALQCVLQAQEHCGGGLQCAFKGLLRDAERGTGDNEEHFKVPCQGASQLEQTNSSTKMRQVKSKEDDISLVMKQRLDFKSHTAADTSAADTSNLDRAMRGKCA
jgi:hypothetical protein